MAIRVRIRSKLGSKRSPGSIQVPVNTQDSAAAIEQLQDTVNALTVRFNAHVHASSGAGVPTILLDGTVAADAGLFTPPPTS